LTNALSWGTYGATRGIEHLLRALDRPAFGVID
jgi:hypothetical protein